MSSEHRAQRALRIIGWLFGGLFCLLNPPYQLADEAAHMQRVYQLSQGVVVGPHDHDGAYALWPEEAEHVLQRFRALHKAADKHFRPEKLAYGWLRAWSESPVVRHKAYASSYSPVAYVPFVPIVALARWIGLPAPLHLYLARLAGLSCYLALIGLALRWAQGYRLLIFAVALLPMALWQASGVSADTMTHGLAMLTIAWLLRSALYESAPLRAWELALSVGLVTALGLCKVTYTPYALLFLTVPRARFGGTLKRLASVALIFAVALLSAIGWLWLSRTPSLAEGRFDPAAQLALISHEPMRFFSAVVYTCRHEGWLLVRTFVGRFGRYDAASLYLPGWLVPVSLGTWLLATLTSVGPATRRFSRAAHRIFAGTSGGMALLVFLAMYLAGTAVGAPRVEGVQGRYFIPIALPAALVLAGRCAREHASSQRRISVLVIAGVALALIVSVGVVVTAYYA